MNIEDFAGVSVPPITHDIPTMQLRWLRVNTWEYKRNGERGSNIAGQKNILQQLWLQPDGEQVWRDVPVVHIRDTDEGRPKSE